MSTMHKWMFLVGAPAGLVAALAVNFALLGIFGFSHPLASMAVGGALTLVGMALGGEYGLRKEFPR